MLFQTSNNFFSEKKFSFCFSRSSSVTFLFSFFSEKLVMDIVFGLSTIVRDSPAKVNFSELDFCSKLLSFIELFSEFLDCLCNSEL